jgi:hypothetical protein
VQTQSEEICKLVEEIYERFHREHGLPRMHPVKFSIHHFTRQYRKLQGQAEAFRNSPALVITEQHFVIKKFFITLVSRARSIFEECDNSARLWTRAVLAPIHTQIQEHKVMIDRRLENLDKLRNNHASLGDRIMEMKQEQLDLQKKANVVNNIMNNLKTPPSATRH